MEYLAAFGSRIGTGDLTEIIATVVSDHMRAQITVTASQAAALACDCLEKGVDEDGAGLAREDSLLSELSGLLSDGV